MAGDDHAAEGLAGTRATGPPAHRADVVGHDEGAVRVQTHRNDRRARCRRAARLSSARTPPAQAAPGPRMQPAPACGRAERAVDGTSEGAITGAAREGSDRRRARGPRAAAQADGGEHPGSAQPGTVEAERTCRPAWLRPTRLTGPGEGA